MSKKLNLENMPRNIREMWDQNRDNPEFVERFHNHYQSQNAHFYDNVSEEGPPAKVARVEADSSQDSASTSGATQGTVQSNSQISEVSSSESTDIEMGLPGTAKGQGGSGDGNSNSEMPMYVSPSPHTNFGKKMSTYSKVHRFMTFAITNTWISETATGPPAENQRYLTTALAEIPWEKPFLYMTPAEFNLLPSGAYVSELRISVIHKGVRIGFETAAADTTLATLNDTQQIHIGFGLNKTGWGVNKAYGSFDATQTMKPATLLDPVYVDYAFEFYGNPNATIETYVPNHQIGFKMPLRNYFNMVTKTQNFGGTPCLAEKLIFMDGKTTINKQVGSWSWKPKFGMLTAPLKHNRWGLPAVTNAGAILSIHTNGLISDGRNQSILLATNGGGGQTVIVEESPNNIANNTYTGDFLYYDNIDKSQFYKQGPWGLYNNPEIQPSIHIGVQAIPALTTNVFFTPVSKWRDAATDWEVHCEMDVMEYSPTAFPHTTAANVPAGDQIMRTLQGGIYPNANSCTYAGLYPTNSIL